jgi:hypothetical protein
MPCSSSVIDESGNVFRIENNMIDAKICAELHSKESVNMDKCFWEEKLSKVSIFKNNILLNHFQ